MKTTLIFLLGIPGFYFRNHLIDIRSRVVVFDRQPQSFHFSLNTVSRILLSGRSKGLSHPFGDGHSVLMGNLSYFIQLFFIQKHLQSLTHINEYN